MRERRALRFVVEALFLGALAVALVVADQEPLVIAGVMLLGWLVVALYEWAATRELPHYGRGLPPRYYVPQVSLPPARQLEQLQSRYPAPPPDDQATWIASPAMRAEALAEWPVAPVDVTPIAPTPGEDTMIVDNLLLVAAAEEEAFHEDTWIELDPVAEGGTREPEPPAEPKPEPVAVAVQAKPEVAEPEPEPVADAAQPAPIVAVAVTEAVLDEPAAADEQEAERKRWWRRGPSTPAESVALAAVVVELADEPESPEADEENAEVVAASAEPAPPAEPEALAEPEPAATEMAREPEPEAAAVLGRDPEFEEDTEEDVVASRSRKPVLGPSARHTFDPLGDDSPARRRWRRRDDPWVELPERPPRPRALPGSSSRKAG